ncbi:MAG: ribosome biogenesis/translation initiation ATPase RLI, partial [Candidatus Diapherotrites archaeon]|nr:ribosome biogenesis/translation initiation ATPase RLI [Candidatus Diapherotrites archaeon]
MALIVPAKKRIAVIDYDLCNPEGCGGYYCEKVCPVNRTGQKCIEHEPGQKPTISETTCIGCMICVKKCPFGAISIINLSIDPGQTMHQFGENSYRLYRLPYPKKGEVVGLIGRNGIGKTTALNILTGNLVPNLGNWKEKTTYENVINFFKGKEIQEYFKNLSGKKIKSSLKPQMVEELPKYAKGTVKELLSKVSSNAKELERVAKEMNLSKILDRDIANISGGELQRLAIAAAVLKEADFYFFDEPSSYLDVRERLNAAKVIRELAKKNKSVMAVEHDLAVLDYLSDSTHLFFGEKSVYGAVSHPKTVLKGINEYLEGFISDENLKFRPNEIKFQVSPPSDAVKRRKFLEYP